MSTSAAARYSTVAKPWLNFDARSIFVDELLRDRLAGLVVQREAVQHLGRRRASARGAATGTRRSRAPRSCRRATGSSRSTSRPCSAWPNSWNSVVASSQLTRIGSPGCALHEVRVVRDDRRRPRPSKRSCVAVLVHPRARALARRARTGRSTRGRRACPSASFTSQTRTSGCATGHARSTGVELRSRRARPATQNIALAQLLELQVGLDLVLVEVVLRLAHLLGVVAVVPRLDRDLRRPPCRRSPACRRPPRARARRPASTPPPSAPSRARASSPSCPRRASARASRSRAASRARRAASGSRR